MNTEFIKKYIKEIEAFCDGKDVEFKFYEDGSNWNILTNKRLDEIFKLRYSVLALRVKPKTEYVYVNTFGVNTGPISKTFKTFDEAMTNAYDDFCESEQEYLSVAVKTKVKHDKIGEQQ